MKIFLLLSPPLAMILSMFLKLNYLESIFLFFGIPSFVFSLKKNESIVSTAVFTAIYSLIIVIFIDHLAALDHAWYVSSIFPFRIFGTVPIDDLVLGFLFYYSVIMFYKYFFDRKERPLINSRIKYTLSVVLPAFLLFLLSIILNPKMFAIHYFYFTGGIIFAFIPSVLFLLFFPRFLASFLKTTLYFFFVWLLYEIAVFSLGYWSFPGTDYVGWFIIDGHKIPYEEIFLFLFTATPSVLTYFMLLTNTKLKQT